MAEGVQYREVLIKSLEKSLQSAFNQPSLLLTRKPHKPGGEFPVRLAYGGKNVQTGAEQMAMEILTANGQPSSFYFGFVANFAIITRDPILLNASLTVFQDIYGELMSVFRAEWDRQAASDVASKHAQPHWHLVQSPEQIEILMRNLQGSGEFDPTQKSEIFGELADCARFHYAMVSLWDKNIPSHKHIFQSDDFLRWFKALTEYIAGQVAYLVKHAPATPAKEFVPSGT